MNLFEMAKNKIQEKWLSMTHKEVSAGVTTSASSSFDVDPMEEDFSLDENTDGVKYYTTENNPLAAGAPKVEAGGIDRFGEESDVVPEELTANNTELSERFYTPGLH